ncbi:right-handed parallel beta-helix repeat-containing protein [Spongisporangium articulatum]|uniref:Right-handed parallel beta-helix repeat-containing protein n=1 Tax=Spongisporangium articulatum TaxID=3362603 RepID=A0ABW8AU34_9ACTN
MLGAGIVLVVGLLAAQAGPAGAARVTALCTNSSTDSATLQAAIDGSSVGDEIVIDGPCSLTATLVLAGGRSYRGDGRQATLTQAAGRNLGALLASDSWAGNWTFAGEPITLRDLTIDANRAANPSAGDAVVVRSWNSRVEDLTIYNAAGNGLTITATSRNGTGLGSGRSQVNGLVRGVFVSSSGKNGIYVQDPGNAVTDWNLLDSWVAGSGQNGIRLENGAGWRVSGNHVYGIVLSGISVDRLFGTTVADNYVEDFGAAGNGIGVTVQGDSASTISGNKVFQYTGGGGTFIAVRSVTYGTGNLAVTGNTVRGNGSGTGLSYQRGSNGLVVTSTGNAVAGVATQRNAGSGVTVTAGV